VQHGHPNPAEPDDAIFRRTAVKRCLTYTGAVVCLLATAAFAPTAALAQSKCDNPSAMIDQRACAKAAEGADALCNFVSRTRMIWGPYYWDYARRDAPSASATAASKTVVAAAGSR
jgi:hypothetical protein